MEINQNKTYALQLALTIHKKEDTIDDLIRNASKIMEYVSETKPEVEKPNSENLIQFTPPKDT